VGGLVTALARTLLKLTSGSASANPWKKTALLATPRHPLNPHLSTRTWSNQIWPLSTPFSPILGPWSRILTPGMTLPASSRRRTTNTCGPSQRPLTVSCAKTVQILPCWPLPPIQYLEAVLSGVLMMNSPVVAS
jgi:hypothetical protein